MISERYDKRHEEIEIDISRSDKSKLAKIIFFPRKLLYSFKYIFMFSLTFLHIVCRVENTLIVSLTEEQEPLRKVSWIWH